MRFAPVMLALLLALSPGVVAVQTTAPSDDASLTERESSTTKQPVRRNTTAVLTLGSEPQRTSFETSTLSLGSALSADRNEVAATVSIESLKYQLQSADSASKKKLILNRYRYQLENRVISLQAREQRVMEGFNNGSLSAAGYARKLADIDAESRALLRKTKALKKQVESVPGFAMPYIERTIRGKLLTLQGPVRQRIGLSLRGEAPAVRTYLATSKTGIALTMVENGQYVREVVRKERRKPGATSQLNLDQARSIVYEEYTWAKNNPDRGTSTDPYGTTNVYSVTIDHSHGRLTAYLDGGTKKIFKETQYKRLAGSQSLPPGPGVENTSENTTLIVNRTYPGGPLRVELVNATGAPLDGTVTVAGTEIGRTGPDGVVWTLGPPRQFRVSATHDAETVTLVARPTDPPALNQTATKSS